MSGWRRCETCRKVLAADAYSGDDGVCTACLTGPAPKPKVTRASPVKTTRVATPRAPKPEPGPRAPLLGSIGSGDLEVRERRALRMAQQQLVELHSEEYAQLLASARGAEGLRPLSQ